MSPVFPSYFGLHLAQCTGRRPPTPRPFDEVREDVLQQLITEDQHQKSREWVELLKKQATIEERDEPSPTTL
jgi:parvulin-like peptidyl-prolyl isomerase